MRSRSTSTTSWRRKRAGAGRARRRMTSSRSSSPRPPKRTRSARSNTRSTASSTSWAGTAKARRRITARDFVVRSVRGFLRKELSDLEQAVLIRFLGFSWKEHLYAMDLLRNSIGLQAFAERDPRVMYKKEGFRFFDEMMMGVREKVT